jgi:hypothetical protein
VHFGLRAEAQLVDVVDALAQVVAAADVVLDLAEEKLSLVRLVLLQPIEVFQAQESGFIERPQHCVAMAAVRGTLPSRRSL